MRGEDLSGLWDGLYSYPRILAPVSFVADLKETGGWLTGTTRETAVSGSATGQNLSATLQGTVREDYSENGDAWNYFSHD
jgi:hypothetical protein